MMDPRTEEYWDQQFVLIQPHPSLLTYPLLECSADQLHTRYREMIAACGQLKSLHLRLAREASEYLPFPDLSHEGMTLVPRLNTWYKRRYKEVVDAYGGAELDEAVNKELWRRISNLIARCL